MFFVAVASELLRKFKKSFIPNETILLPILSKLSKKIKFRDLEDILRKTVTVPEHFGLQPNLLDLPNVQIWLD